MSARVTILLVAVAAIMGIAGCGDDDSSNSATTENGQSAAVGGESEGSGSGSSASSGDSQLASSDLSSEQYAKQANAICRQNTEERFEMLTAYAAENPDLPEDKRLEAAVEDVIAPSMASLAAEIRELGLPEGDEAQVEAIVSEFDQVAQTSEVSEGDLLNPQIAKALKEAREAARAYGLGDCRFK